jgi:hypothetical protein
MVAIPRLYVDGQRYDVVEREVGCRSTFDTAVAVSAIHAQALLVGDREA